MILRNDNQLWQEFKQGSTQALSRIFLLFYDELFAYGRKLCQSEEQVKDCIQSLFLKLWKNREKLDTVSAIKPYLFKSLRHIISDELEAQQRKRTLHKAQSYEYEIVFSQEDFLISQQISQDQHTQILTALNKLSSRQREAIYLRFFEGLDYEKISEIMSINTQSVRNLIHQSFKILKESIVFIEIIYLLLHFCFFFSF
jgi:RNA polymerase sigma factor (sigma-70 family)